MRSLTVRRLAALALSAAALAIPVAPRPATAAGTAITRSQFVDAYVDCNNAAWEGKPRGLILPSKEPTMSDLMRGLDSAKVRGFVGESLYFDGIYGNFQPRVVATLGWALATKTFADRGEIEPQFRNRSTALALLQERGINGAGALSDREVGAIATELDLGRKYQITPIAAGTRLGDPLHAAAARAMLGKVGSHFDVGKSRTIAQPGRSCPNRVVKSLFPGAT
jgi:hypothetical protein